MMKCEKFGRTLSWPDMETIPAVSGETEENHEEPHQDSRCPCRDSNQAPCEYMSRALH
jgi:hypothetical protein